MKAQQAANEVSVLIPYSTGSLRFEGELWLFCGYLLGFFPVRRTDMRDANRGIRADSCSGLHQPSQRSPTRVVKGSSRASWDFLSLYCLDSRNCFSGASAGRTEDGRRFGMPCTINLSSPWTTLKISSGVLCFGTCVLCSSRV